MGAADETTTPNEVVVSASQQECSIENTHDDRDATNRRSRRRRSPRDDESSPSPSLRLTKEDLFWVARRGHLNEEQVDDIWDSLQERSRDRSRFNAAYVLYYLGAVIVFCGMIWLMAYAWQNRWGAGIFFVGLLYIVSFGYAAHYLWHEKRWRIPSGLLGTFSVSMVPLTIYGFQRMSGLWYHDMEEYYEFASPNTSLPATANLLSMEIGTIVAGILTVRYIIPCFPPVLVPVVFSIWYMTVDWTVHAVAALVLAAENEDFDDENDGNYSGRFIANVVCWTSIVLGVIFMVVGYYVDSHDLRARDLPSDTSISDGNNGSDDNNDDDNNNGDAATTVLPTKYYAFWLYLYGLLPFWIGWMTVHINDDAEWWEAIRCLVNIGLVVLSVTILRRRFIFTFFGGLGIVFYLFHLQNQYFNNSFLFPIIITLLGTAVIGWGVLYRSSPSRCSSSAAVTNRNNNNNKVAAEQSRVLATSQHTQQHNGQHNNHDHKKHGMPTTKIHVGEENVSVVNDEQV